jgi:hypothetical protein
MNIKDFNESCGCAGMRDDMKCSFCGERTAESMWTTKGEQDDLFCCTTCAVSILPVIIADSIPKKTGRMVLNWYTERAISAFWKAMTIRFMK